MRRRLVGTSESVRGFAKTLVFLLKVFPMLPSRPVNWFTPRVIVESFEYPTSQGPVIGDLYRPDRRGPHPGILVCLGVVPFGVDHPQVPRLGEALARSGVATVMYWSPAMRDHRLDPADIEDIASAYEALLARPDVDERRSGLLGTCVGGSFALMAAADERIRDRASFVLAYAPYGSMRTLACDIASASKDTGAEREPWEVDPLTRKVYVHTVTAMLHPDDATSLRERYAERLPPAERHPPSETGTTVPLLTALDMAGAEQALEALPPSTQRQLDVLSPLWYIGKVRAPLLVLLHDRDDPVIPVSESRALVHAFASRRPVRYREFTVFKHLDPTGSSPSRIELMRELVRFFRAVQPVFRLAAK